MDKKFKEMTLKERQGYLRHNRIHNTDGTLNFNALAWEAPNHEGEYGFLPTDEYYTDICDWLKTLETRYKTDKVNNKTTFRKSQKDSIYDVVVTYNHSTKMISWFFRKYYEYAI